MRRQRGNFLARRSAQEHLVAAVNQQRDLAAHQNAGLADAHFPATKVFDDRPAASASHPAAPGGVHGGREPEFLQTSDTLLEALDLVLLIAKEHTPLIIVSRRARPESRPRCC